MILEPGIALHRRKAALSPKHITASVQEMNLKELFAEHLIGAKL